MPVPPSSLDLRTIWHKAEHYLGKSLNFYRIHVLVFIFTPFIASGVFFASNKDFEVSYVDSLFVCVSSMTVTGLATIDLSALTSWQQVILLILMWMGSPVTVSWVVVYVRRYIFTQKFERAISAVLPTAMKSGERSQSELFASQPSDKDREGGGRTKIRPEMIHRVEGAQQVDSSRSVDNSERVSEAVRQTRDDGNGEPNTVQSGSSSSPAHLRMDERQWSLPRPSTQTKDHEKFSRTQTVEPAQPGMPQTHAQDQHSPVEKSHHMQRIGSYRSVGENSTSDVCYRRGSIHGPERTENGLANRSTTHKLDRDRYLHSPQTVSIHSARPSGDQTIVRRKQEGFGGFPYPHTILTGLFLRLFPKLKRRLTRTITIPRTVTIHSQHGEVMTRHVSLQTTIEGAKHVPYISFDAIVGRNSTFRGLTRDNLEELGGVEYRALSVLLWIVGCYHLIVPLVGFIIIAPYISQPRWRPIFHPPQQHRFIAPPWQDFHSSHFYRYSLFQVTSAYTNTGTSLVDQSMIPFQKAYPEVIILPLLILAGNTAFVCSSSICDVYRFISWFMTKFINQSSRLFKTLQFLLDHPRRCFIYLFPSHQTWLLFIIIVLFTATDCFFFLLLEIGNPTIASIPLPTRIGVGFLQATAVRAAGFSAVPLADIAPAVKVLYAVMMYISVCNVRSTNVYEERSLGIFHDPEEKYDDEDELAETHSLESRVRIWGNYLASHARKQLSFGNIEGVADMWWLATALFLVCIVERRSLEDDANASWFNIFGILFELISAYGTVGLSLGLPFANYSFSGALRPLSKLIICAVMIRGRHRGLPVAIDRAVIFPEEFELQRQNNQTTRDASGSHGSSRELPGEVPQGSLNEVRNESSDGIREAQ
ncbi:cation transport protein-domain-containing protein [Hysterangium stoloniferum]|nr:cation transport protein-domain-containing protein [Hysterangium stoloniferum]